MDAIHRSSYSERDQMDVPKSNVCESKNYANITHMATVFDGLQPLREEEISCDIRLKTDDGTIIFGHKVVLMSASPYFRAMFTNFSEHKKDIVDIRELDSTVLKLLVDYIYTGKIVISKKNVQVLLPAADILRLEYVKDACVEFLESQLDPSNCLGINAFADLNNCFALLSSTEAYIRKKFLDVIECDEFFSLSTEELIKLISGNVLNAPEEKVYESVLNWVKQSNDRYDSFSKLMEYVRLPLVSLDYISKNVAEELLFKNIPKSKDYLSEALQFHTLRTQQLPIPQTIRNTPRMSGQKVILVFSNSSKSHWYDTTTNLWQPSIEISSKNCYECHSIIGLIKEHFVVSILSSQKFNTLRILDLSLKSPSWVPLVGTLDLRNVFDGFCVLDDCLYAVDGLTNRSAEVYDMKNQECRMIANMPTKRRAFGVGVLNNLLYAVGGYRNMDALTSVECYDPRLDKWTPVAELASCRYAHGVGVLDGVLYAVGGVANYGFIKSVEAYKPSTGGWTAIPDMKFARCSSSVITLDGLLYVVGGWDEDGKKLNFMEIYDPSTNTWSLTEMSENMSEIVGGVIIDKALVTRFHN